MFTCNVRTSRIQRDRRAVLTCLLLSYHSMTLGIPLRHRPPPTANPTPVTQLCSWCLVCNWVLDHWTSGKFERRGESLVCISYMVVRSVQTEFQLAGSPLGRVAWSARLLILTTVCGLFQFVSHGLSCGQMRYSVDVKEIALAFYGDGNWPRVCTEKSELQLSLGDRQ
jgi:hypothetical protein